MLMLASDALYLLCAPLENLDGSVWPSYADEGFSSTGVCISVLIVDGQDARLAQCIPRKHCCQTQHSKVQAISCKVCHHLKGCGACAGDACAAHWVPARTDGLCCV